MKVKILKDTIGKYNLSYGPGEVVDLPELKAKELIEDGYAEKTTEPIGHDHEGFVFGFDKETADSKVKKEKR